MANFCRNCGSPLNAGAAFCPQCGTAAASAANAPASGPSPQGAAVPPVPPAYGSAQPVVTQGGSGMKIILVILCCLAVAGAAVVGGVIYTVHRVKQAVTEKAHEYGVDLPSSSTSSAVVSSDILKNPCKLLSKSEVSDLIGEPIERTEVEDGGCQYYGPPGLSGQLGKEGMSNVINKPDSKQTPGAAADNIDRMIKGMAAQAGQGGSHGDAPLLVLIVGNDGRSQMTAVVAGKAMLSGLQGAGEEIPGLGDRAIRLGNLGLNVLKGEMIIRILPGPISDANQKAIAVARTVLPRI